jgi:hypothetical protein
MGGAGLFPSQTLKEPRRFARKKTKRRKPANISEGLHDPRGRLAIGKRQQATGKRQQAISDRQDRQTCGTKGHSESRRFMALGSPLKRFLKRPPRATRTRLGMLLHSVSDPKLVLLCLSGSAVKHARVRGRPPPAPRPTACRRTVCWESVAAPRNPARPPSPQPCAAWRPRSWAA